MHNPNRLYKSPNSETGNSYAWFKKINKFMPLRKHTFPNAKDQESDNSVYVKTAVYRENHIKQKIQSMDKQQELFLLFTAIYLVKAQVLGTLYTMTWHLFSH